MKRIIKPYQEEPILCKTKDDFLKVKDSYSPRQNVIIFCIDCGAEKITNVYRPSFRCKKCAIKEMTKNRLATMNSWSTEKKEEYRQKISNSMKGKIQRPHSKESIEKMRMSLKETWANKTKEEIDARTQKRQDTINSWSDEEKAEHHNNYVEAQKKALDKKSKSLKSHYAKMTKDERHELFKKLRAKKYIFDGELFDSAYELCFFIKHKEQGDSIEREPCFFEYLDNDNKKHLCFPDFKLNNVLIEIKGEHFLKDGKWINPYSKIQDGILELKRQCLLQNNVKILYYNDIKDCIDYVINKYGKNFKKIFRRK